ncbi:hypothetical protein ACH42_12955 [Endozoicomonas sp. (ex Bugula neritina AB1)]|nr:hypothetical protein ACH42_12955 [Endozoicomonas sp. (ex Bugula neritina AB1)]
MIKPNAKNRSKRLRKKLFVEEFKVLGFEVDMSFSEGTTDEALNTFFDDFLGNVIEENDMVFGGGGSTEGFSGFVIPAERYASATDAQRQLVGDWFEKNALISEHKISELVDANFIL